jgi:uncharacterized protein YidB (DUF937 family)
MGLLDLVNGVLNGAGGQAQPNARGGMSPMTMAMLGLLAYKTVKSSGILGGAQPAAQGGGLGGVLDGFLGGAPAGVESGLSNILPGGLGGLFGGASAGTALSGGLANLIQDLQNAGHGQPAQSWVGTGPNQQIPPNDLAAAIGGDTLDALVKQTGMSRDDLLAGLSQHLPGIVDKLTPQGRLPTGKEAAQLL